MDLHLFLKRIANKKNIYDIDHGDLTAVFQRSPITNALTCMKIYLYKQNGNVAKERDTSDYFVIQAIYESHINLQPNT